jgi:hypothetical protein
MKEAAMNLRLSSIVACVVISMGLSACVVSPAPRRATVVAVDTRPPPPRVVVVPAPRRGYVWVAGYWRWNGHKHTWVDGHWLRERRGWHWEPAHWEERQGRWFFQPGIWVRG